MKKILLTTFLLFQGFMASATPISDDSLIGRKSGWFQAKDQSCFEVCDKKKTTAEHARLNNTEWGGTFVCRARDRVNGGYVYGNNLYREDVREKCRVLFPNDTIATFSEFRCLCVKR